MLMQTFTTSRCLPFRFVIAVGSRDANRRLVALLIQDFRADLQEIPILLGVCGSFCFWFMFLRPRREMVSHCRGQ